MGFSNQLSSESLLYSCIYGKGLYRATDQMVQDPLGGDSAEVHYCPLLQNIITGEEFYMKLVNCNHHMHNKYIRRILSPPSRSHILWPVDMVYVKDKPVEWSLYVSQEYTDTPKDVGMRSANRGLLFPYRGFPYMINGVRRLQQIGRVISWKQQEIRRIAFQLVKAIDDINRSGYIYADIHLSRFFFMEYDVVYLNFSGLALPMTEIFSEDAVFSCSISGDEYPIEFADPAVYRGLHKIVDFQSQNYSLTALLFYLFMGRYPYDGRLLTGYVDDSVQHHYIKFRDYLKMPVFIFDPEDKQNALGAFAEEEAIIVLWNELPEQVKEMFISTLRKPNAERTDFADNPTPSMWLRCFESIGWDRIMEVS